MKINAMRAPSLFVLTMLSSFTRLENLQSKLQEEETGPNFSALPYHYMEVAHLLLEEYVHFFSVCNIHAFDAFVVKGAREVGCRLDDSRHAL